MKKIFVATVLILAIALGALYIINGKSHYDPTKYSLKITPDNKPFGVGSKIEFVLPDQFDKPHTNKDTKKLIFAFTKQAGHEVKAFMQDKPKGYLEKLGAVIVLDVSPMPTVILNTFALPDLRKSNFTMMLIYDSKMAKKLESGLDKTKIAVISLDNGVVKSINYATSRNQLEKLLK